MNNARHHPEINICEIPRPWLIDVGETIVLSSYEKGKPVVSVSATPRQSSLTLITANHGGSDALPPPRSSQ